MTPGNDGSAANVALAHSQGSLYLRSALVESSFVASRTETYPAAQFGRIAARRGGVRAAVAVPVAHSIIVIAYQLRRRDTTYATWSPATSMSAAASDSHAG